MDYEWDEAKRVSNLAKHEIDFAQMVEFDWETAVRFPDLRHPYGERRWLASGMIGERLYAAIYTGRGTCLRIISVRKANRMEVARYEQAFDSPNT